MSSASGDPLFRSDLRTTPVGAQQADLAPVSTQPDAYWVDEAAEREAAEPPSSVDPLGAQPAPAVDDPSQDDAEARADSYASNSAPPPAQPNVGAGAPPPAASGASDTSASAPPSSTVRTDSGTAAPSQPPSDPEGVPSRNAEGDVVESEAATYGSSLAPSQLAQAQAATPVVEAASWESPVAMVAESALAQAANASADLAATAQDLALTRALDEVADLTSELTGVASPALQAITEAGDRVSVIGDVDIDAPLSLAVDDVASDALSSLPSPPTLDLAPASALVSDIGIVSPGAVGAVTDDVGALTSSLVATPSALVAGPDALAPEPTSFLAALFTPAEDADEGSAAAGLPSIDLGDDADIGGLIGGLDDHPDLIDLGP